MKTIKDVLFRTLKNDVGSTAAYEISRLDGYDEGCAISENISASEKKSKLLKKFG